MFIFNTILSSTTSLMFMPHGMCYLWKPGLVGLHILSNALIALSYFSIPLTLIYIVRQRGDLPFNKIFFLFAAFIIFCGTGHLFDIWTLWHPNYWVSSYIRILTALVSVATAIALIKLIPQIQALPSTQQMAVVNQELNQKIKELEETQIVLQEKEQFLQTIFNNIYDGVAACDGEGKLTQFNPACQKLFGLPEKSLPPEQWSKHYRVYYPDGKTLMKREDLPLVRAFNGESVRNAEVITISESGKRSYLAVNGDPILDVQGKNIGAVTVAHDISDRKQAEKAIVELNKELETRVKQRTRELETSNKALKAEISERQRAEDSLRLSMTTNKAILNAIPDLILRIDRAGILVNFKTANATNFWLSPKSESLGKPIEKIFPQELAIPITNAIESVLTSDRIKLIECQLPNQDKTQSYEIRMVTSGENEVMAIVRDISDRKQAEADIRKSLEQEKKLSELKSRFVTMASHEFRTPLAAILSSCELLEHHSHKWSEDKKLTHFHRIQGSVKHMTGLLNDVLLLGKVEAGKLEFKPSPINLPEFCQDVVEEIQSTTQTHQILFQVKDNRETDEPVSVDKKILKHILYNLLSNAIKYSPEGDRVIFDLVCQAKQAIFRIRDFGIGIPLEEQTQLFNSFHRANNVGSIPGTGLGLSIVKRSLDLHRGTIVTESELGQGTVFTVTLPVGIE